MAAIIEKLVRTANATEFVTVRIPDHREKPP
jgi:hypothetical protein